MALLDKIKALSKSYSEEVIGLRRHLHANPELSYQEYNTVKFVEQTLRSFGTLLLLMVGASAANTRAATSLQRGAVSFTLPAARRPPASSARLPQPCRRTR